MTERKTVVYPNPQVLAEAVAARTLLTIIDLLAEPNRKRVDIAVTGGTDGNRVFAAMNASPLNDAVDWSRVHVWCGDERFVAADDDDRNAKQAREAWYGALVESGRMPAAEIDGRGATGTGAPFQVDQNYTIVVATPSIAIDPPSLPNGTAAVPYSQNFSASGGAAPYTFQLTSGAWYCGAVSWSGIGLPS